MNLDWLRLYASQPIEMKMSEEISEMQHLHFILVLKSLPGCKFSINIDLQLALKTSTCIIKELYLTKLTIKRAYQINKSKTYKN